MPIPATIGRHRRAVSIAAHKVGGSNPADWHGDGGRENEPGVVSDLEPVNPVHGPFMKGGPGASISVGHGQINVPSLEA